MFDQLTVLIFKAKAEIDGVNRVFLLKANKCFPFLAYIF